MRLLAVGRVHHFLGGRLPFLQAIVISNEKKPRCGALSCWPGVLQDSSCSVIALTNTDGVYSCATTLSGLICAPHLSRSRIEALNAMRVTSESYIHSKVLRAF